ncbi:unnamed protein product [Moneuplotes crassus]|uniref:Uncharacterized protein n=1 Tax=Euplotes crassus TaxID=5936 RepID=A0AAD2D7M7_EUPCR|nr:unnamed protein product [Moneuplotes crassus]
MTLRNKISDFQKECLSLRGSLKDKTEVTDFLDYQATAARIYAEKKSVKGIYKELKEYLKRTEFELFSEEFDNYKSDIKQEREKSQKQNLEIEKLKNEIEVIHKNFEEKAGVQDVELIKQKMKRLVLQSEFDDLRKKVFPEVKKMQKTVLEFDKAQSQHNEIIRRFDEVLLEKASKTSVQQILHKLKMDFVEKDEFKIKLVESDKRFTDNSIIFKGIKQEIKSINERISNEISENIRQITKNEADKIVEDMKKMLKKHTNGDELLKMKQTLDKKANQIDIEELYDKKTDKADTECTQNSIEVIHKQIKHLVMMLMESCRVLMEAELSNKQTKINKLNTILQQCFILAKWVSKFNPGCTNVFDLVMPDDMQNFQDFVKNAMEEIPFSNVKSYENKQALTKKIQRINTLERTPKPPLLHLGSVTAKTRILNHFQKREIKGNAKKNYTMHGSARKNKNLAKAKKIMMNFRKSVKDDTALDKSYKTHRLNSKYDEDRKVKVVLNNTLDYYH